MGGKDPPRPPWLEGLSLLCHDLRRPLTVIRGAATLLAEADDRLAPASRARVMGLIERSVREMSDLIDELSLVARLNAGVLQVSMQPVPVDELLRAALGAIRESAPEATVRVSEIPPLEVEADRELAVGALRAVLLYALGRSPEPRVEVHRDPEAAPVRLLVRVPAASGPASSREPSFEPLASGGEDPGLGLHLARGLARAMGGELVAAAAPDGELVFSFTLNRRA